MKQGTPVSEAKLEALGEGRYRVSGVLDAVTVPGLLRESMQRMSATSGAELQIDLGGVKESDSAGLALVLEWLRQARHRNQKIRFANVPRQIAALAKISEVDALILGDV